MKLTEEKLAELKALAERFLDTDLGLALSKGCLDLIADLEEMQVRYECNTAIMHARTARTNELANELAALAEAKKPATCDKCNSPTLCKQYGRACEHGEVDQEAIAPRAGSLITDQRMAELARRWADGR